MASRRDKISKALAQPAQAGLDTGLSTSRAQDPDRSSARPSPLDKTMPTYQLRGVAVDFPHEAYACQLDFMSSVIEALQTGQHALLESPTGTGKTLCLLCAALAWQQTTAQPTVSTDGNGVGSVDSGRAAPRSRIVYASRTHSQLQQVIRELKLAVRHGSYDPAMCVLGSRDQMCVHPEVSELRGVRQKAMCKSHVASRTCNYREGVEAFIRRRRQRAEIHDIEDLGELGRRELVCPFFAVRELQANADIIFLPYNYLIDKSVRRSLETNLDLAGSVLIFDEAHNLEGLCSDASSLDLHTTDLQNAVREVETVMRMLGSSADLDSQCSSDELEMLKGLLEGIVRELDAVVISKPEGLAHDGQWALEFFDRATKGQLNFATRDMLLDLIDRVVSSLSSASDPSQNQDTLCVQKVGALIALVFQAVSKEESLQHSKFYKVHIHVDPNMKPARRNFGEFTSIRGQRQSGGRIFGYWCFNPGIAMQSLHAYGIRSVILASGTLSPLPSFAAEFQTNFAVTLENPHVISHDQIFVGVLQKGPSNYKLNSSYQTRSDPTYQTDLGNAIVNFSRLFRGGMLVFFPSYAVMEQCLDFWSRSRAHTHQGQQGLSIQERISQNKHVVIEPRRTTDLQECMDCYYHHVKLSRERGRGGAVFFAVCRGKVSEGLDFADDNGRAVIITGIPYAAARDPKVMLKKEYQTRAAATSTCGSSACTTGTAAIRPINGEEWYKQQALRAVNQAIGRVIRHKDDFGAILLCDERFGSQVCHLSKWLRPHARCYSKYGEAYGSLMKFFKGKSDTVVHNRRPLLSAASSLTDRDHDVCTNDTVKCLVPTADVAAEVEPTRFYLAPPPEQQHKPSLLEILSKPLSGPKLKRRQQERPAKQSEHQRQDLNEQQQQNADTSTAKLTAAAATVRSVSAAKSDGAALIALSKSVMTPAEFGEMRTLVSKVRDKKLSPTEFCERIVRFISTIRAPESQQLGICIMLAKMLPQNYQQAYQIESTRVFGDIAMQTHSLPISEAQTKSASGASPPVATSHDASASGMPDDRAREPPAVVGQAQEVTRGIKHTEKKSKQGASLFMLQARGILSAGQLSQFKSLLLQVKQDVLPRTEMVVQVLRIFDEVEDAVDRTTLMVNFQEFVTGPDNVAQYQLQIQKRGIVTNSRADAGQARDDVHNSADLKQQRSVAGSLEQEHREGSTQALATEKSAGVPQKRKNTRRYDVIGGSGSHGPAKRRQHVGSRIPGVDRDTPSSGFAAAVAAAPASPVPTSAPESSYRPKSPTDDSSASCQICTICSGREVRLMVARCQHVACETCWHRWLAKTLECRTSSPQPSDQIAVYLTGVLH